MTQQTHVTFKLPPEVEAAFQRTRGKRRKCSREDFASGYLAALEDGSTNLQAEAKRVRHQISQLNKHP